MWSAGKSALLYINRTNKKKVVLHQSPHQDDKGGWVLMEGCDTHDKDIYSRSTILESGEAV
jgi:hypothetical protein